MDDLTASKLAEAIQDIEIRIDAKIDILQTAFLTLMSQFPEEQRQDFLRAFKHSNQLRQDLGLVTEHPETYFYALDLYASRLQDNLGHMKPLDSTT